MLKNEKLKKMEGELEDLKLWLKLGLVPKKDTDKHKREIKDMESKISEEKDRLKLLKESGEQENYVTPKRNPRASFSDSLPDIDINDDNGLSDVGGLDLETEQIHVENTSEEDVETDDEATYVEDDEDPFSDRSRWKRGIADPEDYDNW